MSIFGNILNKIFRHDTAQVAPQAQPSPAVPAASSEPVQAPATKVDVGAVLQAMAEMKPDNGGNYRTSIVDLLKLLDLDSSLAARKALADELDIQAGEPGSAEQNMALHRAVIDRLEANGGIVPDSLRN